MECSSLVAQIWAPRKVPACLCLGRSLALVAFCVQHLLVCSMEAHSVTVRTHIVELAWLSMTAKAVRRFGFWTVGWCVGIDAAVHSRLMQKSLPSPTTNWKPLAMWRDSAELLEVFWPGQRGCWLHSAFFWQSWGQPPRKQRTRAMLYCRQHSSLPLFLGLEFPVLQLVWISEPHLKSHKKCWIICLRFAWLLLTCSVLLTAARRCHSQCRVQSGKHQAMEQEYGVWGPFWCQWHFKKIPGKTARCAVK